MHVTGAGRSSSPPERPQVLVPRGAQRHLGAPARESTCAAARSPTRSWPRGVTSRVRTVLDCARLPALRRGPCASPTRRCVTALSRHGLSLLAACSRLAAHRRAVALPRGRAGRRAARPTRSSRCIRAISRGRPGAHVRAAGLDRQLRPRRPRSTAGAGSSSSATPSSSTPTPSPWLTTWTATTASCARPTAVLRFGWKHAMFEQDYVRETVAGSRRCARTISSVAVPGRLPPRVRRAAQPSLELIVLR